MKSYYTAMSTISYYIFVEEFVRERSLMDMISKKRKRVNYLMGESDAVYHKIAWKLGFSDGILSFFIPSVSMKAENLPDNLEGRSS